MVFESCNHRFLLSLFGKTAKTLLLRLRGSRGALRSWVIQYSVSFALVSFGVALEENYGAAGSERDRPNGPIGMPILGVWGLWAYAAHKKETKEQRYPEREFSEEAVLSRESRVAAAR
jgi:hypothetical protein